MPLLSQYDNSNCSKSLHVGLGVLSVLGFLHFLLSIAILCVLVKKKSVDKNLNINKISINILHLLQSGLLVPTLVHFTIALSNDHTLSNSTLVQIESNESTESFRERAFKYWWSVGNFLAFVSILILIAKLWIFSFLSRDVNFIPNHKTT